MFDFFIFIGYTFGCFMAGMTFGNMNRGK